MSRTRRSHGRPNTPCRQVRLAAARGRPNYWQRRENYGYLSRSGKRISHCSGAGWSQVRRVAGFTVWTGPSTSLTKGHDDSSQAGRTFECWPPIPWRPAFMASPARTARRFPLRTRTNLYRVEAGVAHARAPGYRGYFTPNDEQGRIWDSRSPMPPQMSEALLSEPCAAPDQRFDLP